MRRYIDIIREAHDPLDVALQKIADYIQHNARVDLTAAADIIKQHGYKESMQSGVYFRALFHPVKDQDLGGKKTLRELFPALKANIQMDMGGVQGFTTSLDAAEQFVNQTLHTTHGHEQFPQYHPDTPLTDLQDIVVIYEVSATEGSIVMSMRGLKTFLKIAPEGAGMLALQHSLFDTWDGYASDDEVMIDTGAGAKVVGVHFYNSDSYDG
jgi:hypothetical protein